MTDSDEDLVQDGYGHAIVCKRGHAATEDTRFHGADGDRCSVCGAALLSACPACGTAIRGEYFVSGVITVSVWTPAEFCHACGSALPWASWKARVLELENVADRHIESENARLRVSALFEQIADRGVGIELSEELRLWGGINELWPGLGNEGGKLAATLISAEAMARLGLTLGPSD